MNQRGEYGSNKYWRVIAVETKDKVIAEENGLPFGPPPCEVIAMPTHKTPQAHARIVHQLNTAKQLRSTPPKNGRQSQGIGISSDGL